MKVRAAFMIDLASKLDGTYNPAYSGRSMFGRTCPAIRLPHRRINLIIVGFLICEAVILPEYNDTTILAEWLCQNARIDDMGYGWVMYWPELEAVLDPPSPRPRRERPPKPAPEDFVSNEY